MKEGFLERLAEDILVMYLPMQTELMPYGKEMESHLSEWVLAHPDAYQDALAKSCEAGCDMGHTATQASSVFRAGPFGVADRVEEFNRRSAELAREVTPEHCFVVGNISVSNPDFMEPLGNYSRREVCDGYKQQALALAEGGVDVLHISGSQDDVQYVAIQTAGEETGLPIIAGTSYYRQKVKEGFRTMMGTTPADAGRHCKESGADVIGFCCGDTVYEDCAELLQAIREGARKPTFPQVNAGMPTLTDGKTVHPGTPEEFRAEVPNWIEAGARMIGGCCGTTLEHYRSAADAVREWRAESKSPGRTDK